MMWHLLPCVIADMIAQAPRLLREWASLDFSWASKSRLFARDAICLILGDVQSDIAPSYAVDRMEIEVGNLGFRELD
jgi:hypothetical protein